MKKILAGALVFVAGMATDKILQLPDATRPLATPAVAATLAPYFVPHQQKTVCPSPFTPRPSYYETGGSDVVRYECLWDPDFFCPPGFSFAQGGLRDYGFLNVPGNPSGIKWTCQQLKVAKN